jgi:hypothetical protein
MGRGARAHRNARIDRRRDFIETGTQCWVFVPWTMSEEAHVERAGRTRAEIVVDVEVHLRVRVWLRSKRLTRDRERLTHPLQDLAIHRPYDVDVHGSEPVADAAGWCPGWNGTRAAAAPPLPIRRNSDSQPPLGWARSSACSDER